MALQNPTRRTAMQVLANLPMISGIRIQPAWPNAANYETGKFGVQKIDDGSVLRESRVDSYRHHATAPRRGEKRNRWHRGQSMRTPGLVWDRKLNLGPGSQRKLRPAEAGSPGDASNGEYRSYEISRLARQNRSWQSTVIQRREKARLNGGEGGVRRARLRAAPTTKSQAPELAQCTLRYGKSGGEGGIRTHEPGFARLPAFEAGSFNRSDTSPDQRV